MSPEQQEAFEVRMAQQEEESRLREKIKARQVANKTISPETVAGADWGDIPRSATGNPDLYLPLPALSLRGNL
ncbi:hypothetical protein P691DRAFT_762523 [Macrolepiota fuliginosa MF-IS2]|uniref:Uncharacterized protein n=1 Tax=Macrolepiota fuliginosa MF-IS2 TaxID=1400762 RepID=A0A9P6BZH3_9AGAR|nr:hypothetical protein P691DRAFT_762523 [Macrolepiota fuliginosa MF-IS2]